MLGILKQNNVREEEPLPQIKLRKRALTPKEIATRRAFLFNRVLPPYYMQNTRLHNGRLSHFCEP